MEEKVLEVMKKAQRPMKAGEICELSGLDKKLVDKAMKSLKENGKINSPKVCYWQAI